MRVGLIIGVLQVGVKQSLPKDVSLSLGLTLNNYSPGFSWQLSSWLNPLHHQVLISLLEEGVGPSQMESVAIQYPVHLLMFHQCCKHRRQASPHLLGLAVC